MIVFLETVFSILVLWFFWKIKKVLNLGKLKKISWRRRVFLGTKTFSVSWKASLTKLEGGKHAGGFRRPVNFSINSEQFKTQIRQCLFQAWSICWEYVLIGAWKKAKKMKNLPPLLIFSTFWCQPPLTCSPKIIQNK